MSYIKCIRKSKNQKKIKKNKLIDDYEEKSLCPTAGGPDTKVSNICAWYFTQRFRFTTLDESRKR